MSRTWKIIAGVAAAVAVAVTVVLALGGDEAPWGKFPVVVLTYEVAPVGDQTETQARDQAITGIRERLDQRGLEHASVVPAGASRVRVEIGGKDVPFDRVIELIQRSAVLGVHRVVENDRLMQAMYRAAHDEQPDGITAEVDMWTGPDGTHNDYYVSAEDRSRLEAWVQTRGPSAADLGDRRVAYERVDSMDLKGKPRWRSYLIENAAILDGSNVARAEVTYDPNTLRPEVNLELDRAGGRVFATATTTGVGKKLAIVLDGRVMSAPVIQGAITGGRISVTMGGNDPQQQERDAADLVSVLRTGTIPPLLLIERRTVGPAR